MQSLKTSPALVPPPPVPPAGRVAAASQEPSREPSGLQTSFLRDVLFELRRFVWPVKNQVSSASLVTVGLLSFLALYIFALDAVAGMLFHALGFYSK